MTFDFLRTPPFSSASEVQAANEAAGARFGPGGGHLSRTMMLPELGLLLQGAARPKLEDLRDRAIAQNCLGKSTLATRLSSFQRLRELYGLDTQLPLFAALLTFWNADPPGQPLLAMQLALARDPLFRASTAPILAANPGELVPKPEFARAIEAATDGRHNAAVIDKIARHVGASWSQTGHLKGRVFKVRQKVTPTPAVVAYTALIGYLCGLRGEALFVTVFARLLDTPPDGLLVLASEAHRLGFMSFRHSGGVVEVSFPNLSQPCLNA